MEFPSIGSHCSHSFCRQLDFLPIKCDACEKQFCKDHIRYDDHSCESSYRKNVQVPVCPLCNKPVPVPRGEVADIKVGEHIDRDCQSDPAKKQRKAYANKCSAPKCKQKELMPVLCSDCRLNFCLRHRHPQDHNCKGFQGSSRSISISNSGAAAIFRASRSANQPSSSSANKKPQHTTLHGLGRGLNNDRVARQAQSSQWQGNMSEDEALAKALQLSLEDKDEKPLTQEEKDRLMAQRLQEEEDRNRAARRRQDRLANSQQKQDESSCVLS